MGTDLPRCVEDNLFGGRHALFDEPADLMIRYADFVEALNTFVRWYNEKRIKGSLGYLSPIEYRENLGLTT